ncbi:hypothetical protein [Streptomyces hoynatensis]|uniref:Uncharacterized protein n=1 Tax=Streptomyces hoynatensis TaxID=1141874 RepID=A0A3A9ZBT1_9ACTN|nr:hypothetical protein [Streptomyces hoynatensis]RKN45569.1 hypothetical protein D7294_03555 [Streptomyces hoynatensis]
MITLAAALAATSLAATPGHAGEPAAAAAPGTRADARPAAAPRPVTLPTGERVRLGPDGELAGIDSPRGQEEGGGAVITERVDGHVYVIPLEAAARVEHGEWDREQFDVTRLSGLDPRRPAPAQRYAPTDEEAHTLTLSALDRSGTPDAEAVLDAYNLDTAEHVHLDFSDEGVATGEVPAGRYLLTAMTGLVEGTTAIAMQVEALDVHGDEEVAFDAREAEAVDVSVFDAEAEPTSLTIGVQYATGESLGLYSHDQSHVTLYTQGEGLELPGNELTAAISATWGLGSTPAYNAEYTRAGSFFTGFEHRVERSELAELQIRQGSPVAGRRRVLQIDSEHSALVEGPVDSLTRTDTVYVTGNTAWRYTLWDIAPDGSEEATYSSPVQVHEPGTVTRRTINTGVYGPGYSRPAHMLGRLGDELYGDVSLFADGQDHAGGPYDTEGTTILYQDGEELAALGNSLQDGIRVHGLPPQEETYRLVTTARRLDGAPVSTEVSASFEFTSAAAADGAAHELPLSVIRFTPDLALDSTAPAGRRLRVPVLVDGAAADAGVASLSVEVSFDRGETWENAPVENGAITVHNPPAGGSVSLRAELTDADGLTTTVTIKDAYLTR